MDFSVIMNLWLCKSKLPVCEVPQTITNQLRIAMFYPKKTGGTIFF